MTTASTGVVPGSPEVDLGPGPAIHTTAQGAAYGVQQAPGLHGSPGAYGAAYGAPGLGRFYGGPAPLAYGVRVPAAAAALRGAGPAVFAGPAFFGGPPASAPASSPFTGARIAHVVGGGPAITVRGGPGLLAPTPGVTKVGVGPAVVKTVVAEPAYVSSGLFVLWFRVRICMMSSRPDGSFAGCR